jgi:hypothetical protein
MNIDDLIIKSYDYGYGLSKKETYFHVVPDISEKKEFHS